VHKQIEKIVEMKNCLQLQHLIIIHATLVFLNPRTIIATNTNPTRTETTATPETPTESHESKRKEQKRRLRWNENEIDNVTLTHHVPTLTNKNFNDGEEKEWINLINCPCVGRGKLAELTPNNENIMAQILSKYNDVSDGVNGVLKEEKKKGDHEFDRQSVRLKLLTRVGSIKIAYNIVSPSVSSATKLSNHHHPPLVLKLYVIPKNRNKQYEVVIADFLSQHIAFLFSRIMSLKQNSYQKRMECLDLEKEHNNSTRAGECVGHVGGGNSGAKGYYSDNTTVLQYLRPLLVEVKANGPSSSFNDNYDRLGLLEYKFPYWGGKKRPSQHRRMIEEYELALDKFLKEEGFHFSRKPSGFDFQGFYYENMERVLYLTDISLPLPKKQERKEVYFHGAKLLIKRLCRHCSELMEHMSV